MRIKELVVKNGWKSWLIIPFLGIGLMALFFSLKNIIKIQEAKDWTQTAANVEQVSIDSRKNSKGSESHELIIKYTYIINSKKYSGGNLAFGYSMNNFEDHQDLFRKLQESKKIMVYVNPNDKNESVIIPNINGSIVFVLIFSILWNATMIGSLLTLLYENIKKYIQVLLILIWLGGIYLLLSGATNIDMESSVVVLEKVNFHAIEK
ncbi:DUF3592 domain-containing protein [Flavobacterium turcicum]|uniref:DUF3592 domain-containing protein n=1 Tax=Flavobacterium turcicum TaxID=2764718 RepID=A0ABR7JHH7_9FLAO|nr:DUF3592 domain-containing protein [Flavobacterium turcicum]MBC5863711.1 DUF3592 domain-containing protein [Flavobacterium turcicum]NHL02341.1 DUF3592 domain-containing protein [Flavobacterium turcicum]